jgi:uncharacterized protein YicC (UPF0701 family)
MEAVASASSIITVVQIAASVAKLCSGYILDVKDARWDIERVQQKTAILRDVMEKLAKIDDQTQAKPVSLPAHVIAAVHQCLQDLQELQGKLQPKSKHKAMRKVGWRALKWPLSKNDVNEEVKRLEGYFTIFNSALQLDHM